MTDWLTPPTDIPDDLAEHWEVVEEEPSTFGAPAWRAEAACLNRWDDMLDIETARPICATCPVKAKCLSFALDTEPDDTVVFAATTFADRTRLCPICERGKGAVSLGCCPAHTLLRIARLLQIEAEGDPDVRVTMRAQPTYRTYEHCPQPRGEDHSTAAAYKEGCRCEAARTARTAEDGRLKGVKNPRGPYKRRVA